MNAPWKSGLPGNRDPFSAFICDDNALDVLRPVVIELGWQPEKCCWPQSRTMSMCSCC